jgi:hypothetical protein
LWRVLGVNIVWESTYEKSHAEARRSRRWRGKGTSLGVYRVIRRAGGLDWMISIAAERDVTV